MSHWYVWSAIVAMAAVTFLIRALPFLGARWLKGSPRVSQIGVFLPPAIMALLLIHSVRELGASSPQSWWPALVAVGATLLLQILAGRALVSIASGTVLYMLWLALA